MNKYLLALLPLLAAAGVSSASPLPAAAQKRATNTVVADYVNTLKFPCPKHHDNCPESCGRASEAVVLRVVSNEDYAKYGMYGDRKLDKGDTILIDLHKPIPGQNDQAVQSLAGGLKTGDTVRLTITHYYMDVRGIQSSSRAVTSIAVISETTPEGATSERPAPADDAEDTEEPTDDTEEPSDDSADVPADDTDVPADDTDDSSDDTDDSSDGSSDDSSDDDAGFSFDLGI